MRRTINSFLDKRCIRVVGRLKFAKSLKMQPSLARNTTSHAYNEDKAIAIVEDIPDFLTEAKFLLKQLER